jgi:uncharacterized protein YndB with AHSA1/START domain
MVGGYRRDADHGAVPRGLSADRATGTVGVMADQLSVATEIHASAEQVWAMVADLTRMKEWSPENDGAVWTKGSTGAVPGATFSGTNSRGKKSWETMGRIVEAEPGRVLSFRITAVGMKVALWTYRFEPTATGCRVTESWSDERNALVKALGKPVSGVADRAAHNRAGMEQTLANLKAAAET